MSRKKKTRKVGSLGPKTQPRVKGSKQPQTKKKGKGQPSGQRTQEQALKNKNTQQNSSVAEQAGSRKKIPLIMPGQTIETQAPQVDDVKAMEQRLMQIEHDPRFNRLLDKVERGVDLSKEDQKWFNATLDEAENLMAQLGLEDDEDFEDEDEDEAQASADDEAPLTDEERLRRFEEGDSDA